MRIGLVAPCDLGPNHNPGCHMITAGVRWLASQAMPGAVFVQIDMIHDDPDGWEAARTCDALILCGNPRFTMNPPVWWELGIWDRLLEAQSAGIKVIDGWAGATHPWEPGASLDVMARRIAKFERNDRLLPMARRIRGRIARDRLMQRIYEDAGAESTLLPCASWWAERELPWEPCKRLRVGSAIVLHGDNPEWLRAGLQQEAERLIEFGPLRFIASTVDDCKHYAAADLPVELITDCASLLTVYASVERVLSFKIHAAIPAASVGCAVCLVAFDTRSMTCDEFAIPVIGMGEFGTRQPDYRTATVPDEEKVIAVLRGLLC